MSGPMSKTTAGLLTAGAASLGPLDDLSIQLFNVPITVVAMAAAGSMLSFAYNVEGDENISKKKLYFLAFANTLLATTAVAVLPQMLGWSWMSPKIEGSAALLFAAAARFIVPLMISFFPELLKKWFGIGEYSKANKAKQEEQEEVPPDVWNKPLAARPSKKAKVKR